MGGAEADGWCVRWLVVRQVISGAKAAADRATQDLLQKVVSLANRTATATQMMQQQQPPTHYRNEKVSRARLPV